MTITSAFWMVHGAGPTNHRHSTRDGAEREAKRLAIANPGTEFFVLGVVSGFVKDDVREIEIDQLPF